MKKMFSLMIGGFLGFVIFSLGLVNFGIVNAEWEWAVGSSFNSQNTEFNPSVPGSSGMAETNLLTVVKSIINWALWLLALITLVLLLWGWFQMVTAAGDDGKYKKWFKILQQAGMWLLFISVSWLIVSLIFWVISSFVK